MSNNEIPVGSRWQSTRNQATIVVVTRVTHNVYYDVDGGRSYVCARESFPLFYTRIDAPPVVQVGDIVRDPALLRAGMSVEWAAGGGESINTFETWHKGFWLLSGEERPDAARMLSHGVRVLALPEPEKAEAPCIECGRRECRCDDVSKPVPPPARCAPGCVPAAPCRTEGVCPVFAEEHVSERMSEAWGAKGIAADPPARRHTPPPLRHEGACIAGWNGREGWK